MKDPYKHLNLVSSGPDRWMVLGQYFGYPQCCIDEFCDPNISNADKFDVAKEGFVPCFKHMDEILNGRIKLEDLITNRQCKHKFPKTDLD